MNVIKLNDLARKINQREELIEALKDQTVEKANAAVCEALLQGQDLIAAKSQVKHGDWEDWLKCHCPAISLRTAQVYMRLAENPERMEDLGKYQSLRAAIALLQANTESKDAGTSQPKSWPVFQEGMGKAWKFVEYVKRHPLGQWPSETLEALREDLEPVAAELWPDRWGRGTA